MKYILHDEGRIVVNGASATYEYHLKDHLGNTRVAFQENGIKPIQSTDYYPFGLTMNMSEGSTNKYLYNGKEKQELTDWLDFHARFYDPAIVRTTTQDPMAEDYYSESPYSFMGNNPIINIDPTGMNYNPIYDYGGNFLGTDDLGLQGDAIVMNKEDFEQGMSHDDAMSKGFLANDLADIFAGIPFMSPLSMLYGAGIESHRSSLESRPDWDGKLTLSEANEWYRGKSGEPLYVDAAKISLSPVETSDFGKVGDSFYKNFAFTSNTETGLVYGNIKLTLMNETGAVKLGGKGSLLDIYDFDYKKGRYMRNAATWIGKKVAGEGKGFNIYNYGNGKVK